jgi:hypothetical protein
MDMSKIGDTLPPCEEQEDVDPIQDLMDSYTDEEGDDHNADDCKLPTHKI